ncbi:MULTISPECIES: hypothetical protein [unclassified Rhizobium]|uniref:hypothetical protein n=1 Tax=unclassified Rhizobium TaxID=2613769 RepID=UPI00380A997B
MVAFAFAEAHPDRNTRLVMMDAPVSEVAVLDVSRASPYAIESRPAHPRDFRIWQADLPGKTNYPYEEKDVHWQCDHRKEAYEPSPLCHLFEHNIGSCFAGAFGVSVSILLSNHGPRTCHIGSASCE